MVCDSVLNPCHVAATPDAVDGIQCSTVSDPLAKGMALVEARIDKSSIKMPEMAHYSGQAAALQQVRTAVLLPKKVQLPEYEETRLARSGMLFHGPPRTEKSLIARLVAA